ncbi:MAG: nickel pincer cofactor biosynthesis protein LarB [Anaerotardibacter sp.]
MDSAQTKQLLCQVSSGEVSPEEALLILKKEPFADLGYAKVDHHRELRQGVAEVIYGAGKTPEQIKGIAETLKEAGQDCVLITRLKEEAVILLENTFDDFTYYEIPKIGLVGTMPKPTGVGAIVVACAGTSDLPVAEEAAITAEALGNNVIRLYDVGVSGIHRLLAHMDTIMQAQCIVAVAGMEGALASVIGGMASCPVIAVPTSVGYGASFGGVSALLSMLNSCASGVSVVNIDNGFGAGYQAHLINHLKTL